MPETAIVPNAIDCAECGTTTLFDELGRGFVYDPDDPPPCPVCEDQGREDPYCHQPVRVEPCPLADSDARCEDESHHWGRGDHVIELDQ